MAKSNKDLRIAIIGAGMGGLTAALALAKKGFTNINVYETASNLGFVGAGIQEAPNMCRILDRLGVLAPVKKGATQLEETSIRRGQDNFELAHVDLRYIAKEYSHPHMVGHRADLAGALYDGCKAEANLKFHFSNAITEVKSFGPTARFTVKPRDEESYEVEADVLLAADGIKSVVRTQMLAEIGVKSKIEDTGQAAYRILLDRNKVLDDPEVLALIDSNQITRWIGEKRHIIAYPVADKQIYNLSTVQPDSSFTAAPDSTYTTKGSKSKMLEIFEDFAPIVQRMLNHVPDGEVCEWKLRVFGAIPTWVNGVTALVGDAGHPTLPHLNQGAAQAMEDSVVLAVVLEKMPDTKPETINKALQVYQEVRKERAETLVQQAAASGRALHLGEGKDREERDRQFAALKSSGGKGKVPDKWADAETQKIIYGHDCVQVAEAEFDKIYSRLSQDNKL